jgi:AcrR family transcriptional regulator
VDDRGGLRARKKQTAMRRVQEVALDLFDERGFTNVSVEEIAAAAGISPSSVYRYFGTKEGIVLYDDVDLQFIERTEAELGSHPPVAAVRRAMTDVFADFFERDDELARRKVRYAYEEPALRTANLETADSFVPLLAEVLARSTGRRPDELDVQVIAAALVASLNAAVRHWHASGYRTPLRKEIDRALSVLESGLPLAQRAQRRRTLQNGKASARRARTH